MTVMQRDADTARDIAADWRLAWFRSDGVTACCPAEMGIALAIDDRGCVDLRCGPLRAAGRAAISRSRLVFADMLAAPPPWGPVPTALEDRVAAALDGAFDVSLREGRLTLHAPAATMQWVRVS